MVSGHGSLVMGHWSLVIRAWALVIGHSSVVIGHSSLREVGAGLFTSGCNQKDSSETRPYTISSIS
ncbi:hypothetical protein [Coleofasciculus sp. F4-SAH-05]|uniref:hypothetical protein n=1 Tax=Coleofasciculus sp. F4-SAH-05 TaxID=3069525 RepID=UPI0032FA5DB5